MQNIRRLFLHFRVQDFTRVEGKLVVGIAGVDVVAADHLVALPAVDGKPDVASGIADDEDLGVFGRVFEDEAARGVGPALVVEADDDLVGALEILGEDRLETADEGQLVVVDGYDDGYVDVHGNRIP